MEQGEIIHVSEPQESPAGRAPLNSFDMQDIWRSVNNIDLKVHNQFTREELLIVREKIKETLEQAVVLYNSLFIKDENGELQDVKANKTAYDKIQKCFLQIVANNRDTLLTTATRKSKNTGECFKLYNLYRELTYSFATARRETKNLVSRKRFEGNESTGMILLCKNVRIMEDVINKICVNNIDKSIIGGEQQFDSMRYGFEWLFCHEDINVVADTDADERKRLDIRDSNRYLDYIKYQIMVSGKYVPASCRSSEEVDEFFSQLLEIFDNYTGLNYKEKQKHLAAFKSKTKELIRTFFRVYEILVIYRSLRFQEEEIRRRLANSPNAADRKYVSDLEDSGLINLEITNLSSVAVRVLLDRFVSFVKISDQNFGNSTFKCAWFNYSELSRSNFAGSDFKYARIENARMKDCDLSTCNITRADGGNSDFSGSNFTYSNLCGVNLVDATLNNCDFQNAVFADGNISGYKTALKDYVHREDARDRRSLALYDNWKNKLYTELSVSEQLDKLIALVNEQKIAEIADPQVLCGKIGSILDYSVDNESKPNLNSICEKLARHFLSKHMSTELLDYFRTEFQNEITDNPGWRNNRIRTYGKVYLDAANLERVSAKNAHMSGLLFNRVALNQASFENSDLSGIVMYYNTAASAAFISCNLNGADCFESNYNLANFSGALANNAKFSCCNLEHTNWNKSILVSTAFVDISNYVNRFFQEAEEKDNICNRFELIFGDPIDRNSCLTASSTKNVPFWQSSCNLNNASFRETLADRTKFISIIADRATFNQASMKNSDWFNCQTDLADFIETDFRYSRLAFCKMTQSNFSGANLTMADIRFVDFSNCNLMSTLFNLSKLNHILIENANVRGINLSNATICNSVFSNCKFDNAILTNATFKNCLFSHVGFADLLGFHSASFENCFYEDCTYKRGKRRPQQIQGLGSLREFVQDYS